MKRLPILLLLIDSLSKITRRQKKAWIGAKHYLQTFVKIIDMRNTTSVIWMRELKRARKRLFYKFKICKSQPIFLIMCIILRLLNRFSKHNRLISMYHNKILIREKFLYQLSSINSITINLSLSIQIKPKLNQYKILQPQFKRNQLK